MKKARQFISLILIVSLVISLLPTSASAAEITNENTAVNDVSPKTSADTKEVPKIIGEVPEKREAYVKHFIKDDYSYEAVVYQEPVNYLKDGKWKEVDNSLKVADDPSVVIDNNAVTTQPEANIVKNQSNDYEVSFAQNANVNKLVQMQKGDYGLSWSVEKAQNIQQEILTVDENEIHKAVTDDVTDMVKSDIDFSTFTNTEKQQAKETLIHNEITKLAENASSELIYTGILPNVDLRYKVISGELKEDIILNQYTKDFSITFNVSTDGLAARLEKDNTISFYNKNNPSKIIFQTAVPYMYDPKGETSTEVKVALDETDQGYLLVLTPSDSWLAESGREYPVIIDPVVKSIQDSASIIDTYASSQYPTTNYYNSMKLGVGQRNASDVNKSFIIFDLPALSTSSMVTDATMRLHSEEIINGGTQVNVQKVTASWDSGTLNWNNMPSVGGVINDYQIVNTANTWYDFDITQDVKDWYTSGSNNGLRLAAKTGSNGYASFDSSDNGAGSTEKPYITVSYVDFSGLEGYWTYHSQDVLRAGTGYINDYNGNLVFIHNDLSMNGNRMPLSVSHVFNSNDRLTNIGLGKGWRLNLSQRVIAGQTGDPYDYYYIDEDGTKHYFEESTPGIYKDESGINLTLTKNADNTYTIKDTQNNLLKFTTGGYLSSITDNNGNATTLSYSGTNLISVTDGAGRITTLDYLNGNLSLITDPAGRVTSYEYTSSKLTKITYPDGKISLYTYDGNSNLATVTNHDGYKMTYSYSTGTVKRVIKATESHTNGTTGNEINIVYGYNTTSFTDFKARKDIYQFNDYGNTISIKDSDGNAQYYGYGSGTNENKLTSNSIVQKTTVNYVLNHNAETETNFSSGTDGGTGSCSYSTDYSYMGSKSLKVTKTDNIKKQYYYQKLELIPGNTYTFSVYVKTQDISETNGKGAYISAWYWDNDNVTIHSNGSEYLSGNHEWTRLETTLELPEGTVDHTVTLRMGITSESGTAYFDCLQMEDGPVANRYNLVENGDFRDGSSDFWSTTGTDSNDILATSGGAPSVLDGNSFKIIGNSQTNKNIHQTVNVSGKTGDVFVAGAWAKAASVPLYDSARNFALKLEFVNTDGTKTPALIPFNQDGSDWQYVSGIAIAGKDYNSIIIYGVYDHNENTSYFDGFRLYKEEFGESYTYDANGNIISTKDMANQKSAFEYNSKNDLTKETDPKGNSFNYEYNNGDVNSTKHNLTKATSSENVVYTFSYDSNGNALTSRMEGADVYIESSAAYTSNGNYISQLQDADGNTIDYNYNSLKGVLNSVTDGNGSGTNYTYDTMDRLTAVTKNVGGQDISNNYSYENDRLKSITHNGFSYNFTYDIFGNNTKVAVGSQDLVTNSFEAKTNNLLQSTYGNGQRVNFSYDPNLDRLTEIKSNSSTTNKYEYDKEGNLAYKEDLINNINFRYYYDLSGRLMKKSDSFGNKTGYSYDNNSNLSKLSQYINGANYSTQYGYDKDNRPVSMLYNSDRNNIYNKLENNLIAYYSFNNNDVTDESGNGNNGTLMGGAAFTDGKYGRALKLNGTDAWAELTDFDVPDTFTVSMWVNPYTTNDGQAFLGKHTANGGNIFLLGYWSGTSQLRIRTDVNTQASKTTGYQHLVAVVKKISATQSSVKYYRDNVLLWEDTLTDIMGNTSGKGWTLGQEWDGSSLSDFFHGEIDEVAFYNKDLSATEINDLYNTPYGQNYVKTNYDSLGRLDSKQTSTGSAVFNTEYTYQNGITKDTSGTLGESTTTKLDTINNDGNSIAYTYDRNGNIKTITKDKDKLIAYYSFDHSDLTDDSGNGNDGTEHGGITYVNGISGMAAQFDGVDDWVELTDFNVPESFTVSLWVNPANTNDGQAFLGKHTLSGGNIFLLGNWIGGSQVRIRSVDNSEATKVLGNQHIVAVVKKISDTRSNVKYYRNNVLLWERTMDDVMGNTNGLAWTLGQEWDGTSLSDFFKGTIDEVAFYNDDLTQSEVSDLYNQGVTVDRNNTQSRFKYNELNELTKEETKTSDGLIAYYSFDNSDASDDSGNGNDGTLSGSPVFTPGHKGNAIELDGIDDYVELKDFDVPEAFSISMWVNPHKTDDDQCIIGKNTSSGGNILLTGFWSGGNYLNIRGGASYGGTKTTGYQHWVVNINKVSQTQSRVRLYKNNALVYDTIVAKTLDNIKGRPWLIGQEWDTDTASSFFDGAVDEVAFFDHNLSWSEINNIYTSGITVNKGTTVGYTYDQGGNITSKTETVYDPQTEQSTVNTVNYTYGDANWKDKLTSYDGKAITYDEIGNPLTYNGYTYTWQNGRELAGISGNGLTTGYKYNDEGIRTQKTVNGVTTSYYLEGDQVVYEESYNVSAPNTKFNQIYYTYDGNGMLVSMNLDGVEYYYIRNAQSDIIGLYDKDGVQVASYTYDSWGKLISIKDKNGSDITNNSDTVGYKNQYRYRGYRYDTETGLYYLQSRYYNAEWGRFINADGLIIFNNNILTHNLFSYCWNNPNNKQDVYGFNPGSLALAGTLMVADGPLPFGDIVASAIITYEGIDYVYKNWDSIKSVPKKLWKSTKDLFGNFKKKPVNLPSYKKLSIDMEHILSGHSPNGNRNPKGNKSVFWGMSATAIQKAIQEAYKAGEKIRTQGDRVLLSGYSKTYKIVIEMWVNVKEKIIETAYPK